MQTARLLTGLGPVLLLPALAVAVHSEPRAQRSGASGSGAASGADGTLICADRLADQAGPGCIRASSNATFGFLFPYPGVGSSFTAPAVVAGGWYNSATGIRATVGGGDHNAALAVGSTVAGGMWNTASGLHSTVCGGGRYDHSGAHGNLASGDAAAVVGGLDNVASGYAATVAGGTYNQASGDFAAVSGGASCAATGDYSFAAGRRARADHDGAFVWGDGFDADKTSSAPDQFNVYASGGTRIFSDTAATSGVLLAPGGGSWSSVSDRAAKVDVEPVDPRSVLERLVQVPISTWSYRSQDASIRHMGPMAQDFRAAFGLGAGERTIDTVDPDGVALAAIQGLDRKLAEGLAERDAELAALRRANDGLREELRALQARVAGSAK